MKEFKAFYEKQSARLREEHDAWVKSNWKMRSLEWALTQIKSDGDIDITPAEQVLRDEYEKEKTKNDKMCSHMYNLQEFVLNMEAEAREHGLDWNNCKDIFGY